MIKYIFPCFSLFLLIGCYFSVKNDKKASNLSTKKPDSSFIDFSYKILAKDSIVYKLYAHVEKPLSFSYYRDGIRYGRNETTIDKEYDIVLYNFSQQKPDTGKAPFAKHDRDFLRVGSKKYVFEEIFGNLNYLKTYPTLIYMFMKAYFFEFDKKKYFVAFFNSSMNRTHPNYLVVLVDLTIKNNPILVLCEYQASDDIHCFGDFNQDNRLDFAYRVQLGDSLICKTLINNKFEDIKGYHLVIVNSPFNPKIDLQKSKWFFDLKNR